MIHCETIEKSINLNSQAEKTWLQIFFPLSRQSLRHLAQSLYCTPLIQTVNLSVVPFVFVRCPSSKSKQYKKISPMRSTDLIYKTFSNSLYNVIKVIPRYLSGYSER